jgi:hypothetical protein
MLRTTAAAGWQTMTLVSSRNFCWYQSLIDTADLGLSEQAREFAMAKSPWPNREKGAHSGMRYPVLRRLRLASCRTHLSA